SWISCRIWNRSPTCAFPWARYKLRTWIRCEACLRPPPVSASHCSRSPTANFSEPQYDEHQARFVPKVVPLERKISFSSGRGFRAKPSSQHGHRRTWAAETALVGTAVADRTPGRGVPSLLLFLEQAPVAPFGKRTGEG